jgi:MFS family permease
MSRSERKPSSPLPILFLTVFIDLLGFGIVIPLLPLYAEHYDASAVTIGLLMASFSAMQFVFAPIWGGLSDRIGRRPIILFSLAGSAVSYLLLGLAGSLPALFLARLLAGAAAANIPVAQAYVADTTSPEDRAKGMGMIGAAFGLGFIFGPAIGGTLTLYGYSAPAYAAAGLSVFNLIWASWRLPESARPADSRAPLFHPLQLRRLRRVVGVPQAVTLLLLLFFTTFSFANMETTFALLGQHRFAFRADQIGRLFTYMGLVAAVVQGALIARLVKRFGEPRLIVFGAFSMAAGLLWTPYGADLATLLVALAALSAGQGLMHPSLTSLLSRSADAAEQGAVLGVAQSLSSLARIVGPVWGGVLYGTVGPAAPYVSVGVIMAVAALCAFRLVDPESIADGRQSIVDARS